MHSQKRLLEHSMMGVLSGAAYLNSLTELVAESSSSGNKNMTHSFPDPINGSK